MPSQCNGLCKGFCGTPHDCAMNAPIHPHRLMVENFADGGEQVHVEHEPRLPVTLEGAEPEPIYELPLWVLVVAVVAVALLAYALGIRK